MWVIFLQGFLLLTLFITASVIDIRKREIPDSINIMIAMTGIMTFSPAKFAGILIALPFLITAMLCNGRLGGGDIKFMAAAGFVLGFEAAVAASIVGLTVCLLYCAVVYIFRRNRIKERNISFPLAPFLSTGCMAAYILQNGVI
jgi:leader peptidase (prepilin peptidase)/N-methyltransferase